MLIGEMRDIDSIQIALTMAETGHLVFGTLHTNDAAQAIDRIIDVFPAWRQEQTRVQLAASLIGDLRPAADSQDWRRRRRGVRGFGGHESGAQPDSRRTIESVG